MSQTVGLYLHIPFCVSKCAYCDFYSIQAGEETIFNEYVKALSRHLFESGPSAPGMMVDTVYFGGGTPSLLGLKRLTGLLGDVQKAFRVSPNAEITLEANPDSADKTLLKKLRKAGFNRLSLGIQSTDDAQLKALGRIHTARQARDAFAAARDAGFDNISVDLMYGLPGQTAEAWEETLRDVRALAPEHISCYGLKLEEGTKMHVSGTKLPEDEFCADLYLLAVDFLEAAGYAQYEISNFAKPSRQSRHNMKYWTLEPYLGLGPGAHSDFAGRRWAYVRDLKGYVDGVLLGEDMLAEMEKIPEAERAGEYIMLGLRTAHGISGNEYARRYRLDFSPIERLLERLSAEELARREGDRWRLTPKGFLVSNRIIGALLDSDLLSKTQGR